MRKEYNYEINIHDSPFNCVKYDPANEVDMFCEYVECFNKMKEEGDI